MPKNRSAIKAGKLLRKSKSKAIEWETRMYSRGTRDVAVEVGGTTSQPRPRKRASRQLSAENNDTLQGEAGPQPMNVDETLWVDPEEPGVPMSEKRVRRPACPSLENLTYFPVSARLHPRIPAQDGPLLVLPPRL